MPETDDLIGRTLGDRWLLRYRLGAGGMGAVYLAHDASGGPPAAVKVVKRELHDDADAKARFAREADALRRLDHPCVVRFYDTGESGDLRFIAMELLEGRTLKSRLASRGAMPWRETIPVVRDVVRALQAAHAAGLIHRDLKPENIFLADQAGDGAAPVVKLLDFGVARHTQVPAGQTMTATGAVIGTPGFVAPEVVLKGPSNDPRSDYYGLGATWYEMLTGEKPFTAETPFALAMLHVTQQVPLPTAVRPALRLPARAEALLLSLLAKSPDARPPNAEVLLAELDTLAAEPDAPSGGYQPTSSLHNRFLPVSADETPHTRSGARSTADLLPHENTATAGFTALDHARRGERPAWHAAAVVGVVTFVVLVGAGVALRLTQGADASATAPTEVRPPVEAALPPVAVEPAPPPTPAVPVERQTEAPTPTPARPRAPRTGPGHVPKILSIDAAPTTQ
ncbi:MAG: serine/threonine protein kinase [Deltaproteobacteria bacterium]|nr:serine/threonine protein kinase [Deltaproteobacteria bacterium]